MTAAEDPTVEAGARARDLAPRGSRASVADADPAGELPAAAQAILAAVPGWWAARAADAGLSGRLSDLATAVDTVPQAPALGADPDPSIGPATTSHQLGAAFVAALTRQTRSRHGRHYTPAALAEQLWAMTRRALDHPPRAKLLPGLLRDPACGAGALLLPGLREHVVASARIDPQLALAALPNLVEGVDADPAAVWLANAVLSAETLPLLAAVPERSRHPLRPWPGSVTDWPTSTGQPASW